MRNPSEDLFKLIKELTPREKAHFRKLASLQVSNGEPEYLLVFDEIAKQKTYDEAALKRKFNGRPFLSNFHKMKHFIYGNLLDSLHHFHRESNQLSEMLNRLSRVQSTCVNEGILEQTLAELQHLRKDLFEMRAFDEFDMCRWIAMRVMGLHYSNGVEKKLKVTQLAKEEVTTGKATELESSLS